jgi:hypothetical protein
MPGSKFNVSNSVKDDLHYCISFLSHVRCSCSHRLTQYTTCRWRLHCRIDDSQSLFCETMATHTTYAHTRKRTRTMCVCVYIYVCDVYACARAHVNVMRVSHVHTCDECSRVDSPPWLKSTDSRRQKDAP